MKLIALLFLLVGNLLMHAQQFKVTRTSGKQETEPRMVRYGADLFSLATEMQGVSRSSVNLKKTMHSIEILKYDTALKLVKSIKVSNNERLYGPLEPLLKIIASKLYLVYCKMPTAGLVQFFSAEVNPVSLELGEPTGLLEIQQKVRLLESHMRSVSGYHPNRFVDKSFDYLGKEYPDLLHKTFFFESSPDDTKFFLLWNSGWDNRLFFSVLDKDLKKIRTGEEEVPDEISLSLNSACIDNTANIYIAYSYAKKDKGYGALLINTKGGKSLVKEITVTGGEPYGVFAKITSKEKIHINGAYKENSWNLSGVFIQSINPVDLQLSAVTKTAFPKDLVEIFGKEDWASTKPKNYGLSNNLVLESYMMEDGTMGLIGEFRFTKIVSPNIFHYRGSIFNARFNGMKAVFSRIPKLRVTPGVSFADSYKLLEYKEKLVVLYNDYVPNVNLDISKVPTNSDKYRNSVLVAATIEGDGSIKREIIIDQREESFLSSDLGRQQISATSYFVPLRRIKNLYQITDDIKWMILEIK